MDNKKKNRILNILMVAAIAVIALSAVMAVGHVRGWFGGDSPGAGPAVSSGQKDSPEKAALVDDSKDDPGDAASSDQKTGESGRSAAASRKDSGHDRSASTEGAASGDGTSPESSGSETSAPGTPTYSGDGTDAGQGAGSPDNRTSKGDSASGKSAKPASDGKNQKNYCTVSVICSDILDHMNDLSKGKSPFVPKDGIILNSVRVSFSKGESAYDVTRRTLDDAGIQMEAAYTPVYGSYYIEGINQLYEFDCGKNSGWIYTVNGKSPDYGCSDYTVKNGDIIEWEYTCTGR